MSAHKTSLRDHEVAKQSLPNQIAGPSSRGPLVTLTPRNDKSGFTLVELLVVITIIAILSVIGITVFTGVQKSARDAKRRGDIDAIAKALEVHYNGVQNQNCTASAGSYCPLSVSWFSSLSLPDDPSPSGANHKNYCMWNDIAGHTMNDPNPWTSGCPASFGALAEGVPQTSANGAWKVCASLDNTSAVYCRSNQQ